MRRLAAALLFALATFASFAAEVALPAGATRVTTVEGITEYNLANGLRVLFAPDASKPTTTVNITYLVGSRHENYGETGMAHLLEHLIFSGTPDFADPRAEMQRRGMRRNGTTWTDRTNYFASFPANEADLEWYLRWSSDAMTHSFVAQRHLDSEMTVVRNEMERGENDPIRILTQRIDEAAYSWHNYGKSTIGARADVENVSIERLQAFYRHHYQPDNAVLVVTGRFDEAKTLALVARTFGVIPRPTRKLQPTYTVDPEQQGERSVTVRRVADTQLAMAAYHVPAGPHPDFAAVRLLGPIMADAPSGRLHRALVGTGQAARVFATAYAFREPSLVVFGTEVPQTASLDNARATLLAAIEGVEKDPITEAEVERARAKYLRDFALNANDPERTGVALSGAIAQGDWRLFFIERDRVRALKAADVQRVAAAYLLSDNRTLGLFVPTAAPRRPPAPALVDVAPMVKDYRGDAAVAAGEAFEATPANIEARTRRLRLADGMRVALLPKRTRGGAVVVRLTLHHGDEKALFGSGSLGAIDAAMLPRGAGGMTRAQIQDAFEKLNARVAFTGSSARTLVTIETTRDNLPELMRVVAKALRSPDFPAAELEQLKLERVTAIEAQRREPDAIARNAVARHGDPYPPGHVLHTRTFDEEIADIRAITTERLRAFHRDFLGIGSAELAAVGDFDADALRTQLGELLGGWKSARPYARVPMPLHTPAPVELRFETPDKANAFFTSRVHFPMRDDAPDYAAMLVANRIVGGGPGSMLFKRLRGKEGISYGAASQLVVDSHETHAAWNALAIYAPQNLKRLEQAFREEVTRVMESGFTPAELADAKTGLAQARRLALAQDSELASQLTAQLELDRTMDYVAGVDRAIEAVTLEQANAVFRKYLDPSKLVKVYAGDFAKAK
jgi:zinc protease